MHIKKNEYFFFQISFCLKKDHIRKKRPLRLFEKHLLHKRAFHRYFYVEKRLFFLFIAKHKQLMDKSRGLTKPQEKNKKVN